MQKRERNIFRSDFPFDETFFLSFFSCTFPARFWTQRYKSSFCERTREISDDLIVACAVVSSAIRKYWEEKQEEEKRRAHSFPHNDRILRCEMSLVSATPPPDNGDNGNTTLLYPGIHFTFAVIFALCGRMPRISRGKNSVVMCTRTNIVTSSLASVWRTTAERNEWNRLP